MFPTPDYQADFNRLYEPAEDTYVLLDTLEEQKQELLSHFATYGILAPICVEIGTGTGIITTFLQRNILGNNAFYLTTDLNNYACTTSLETSKMNKLSASESVVIDTMQCNLTSPLTKQGVDLLIFNPPYVPSEQVPNIADIQKIDQDNNLLVDLALCGGKDGMVITNKVLDNLDNTLSENGLALILFCARNKPNDVVKQFQHDSEAENGAHRWNIQQVFLRKAGWEELSVWKFQKIKS